jgi:hypothetical protein
MLRPRLGHTAQAQQPEPDTPPRPRDAAWPYDGSGAPSPGGTVAGGVSSAPPSRCSPGRLLTAALLASFVIVLTVPLPADGDESTDDGGGLHFRNGGSNSRGGGGFTGRLRGIATLLNRQWAGWSGNDGGLFGGGAFPSADELVDLAPLTPPGALPDGDVATAAAASRATRFAPVLAGAAVTARSAQVQMVALAAADDAARAPGRKGTSSDGRVVPEHAAAPYVADPAETDALLELSRAAAATVAGYGGVAAAPVDGAADRRLQPAASTPPRCRFASVFRDHMVLQRSLPIRVWGFVPPGTPVAVTWRGAAYRGTGGPDSVWRVTLPPASPVLQPADSDDAGTAAPDGEELALACGGAPVVTLTDILVGDVLLCSGQSNMHLPVGEDFRAAEEAAEVDGTPASAPGGLGPIVAARRLRLKRRGSVKGKKGRGRVSAAHTDDVDGASQANDAAPSQAAAAAAPSAGAPRRRPPYATIRLLTVGHCGVSSTDGGALPDWKYVDAPWARADSSAALLGPAWGYTSSLCWHTAKRLHAALGGAVPVGVIVAAWRGTPIQAWMSPHSAAECSAEMRAVGLPPYSSAGAKRPPTASPSPLVPTAYAAPAAGGSEPPQQLLQRRCDLGATERPTEVGAAFNALIAPLTVGPLAMRSVLFYQGESNTDAGNHGAFYGCAFPALIDDWRRQFGRPSSVARARRRPAFARNGGVSAAAAEALTAPAAGDGGPPSPAALPPLGFHYVQLAPWVSRADVDGAIAPIRAAQLAALALPRVSVASAADLGDPTSPLVGGNIHPRGKALLAARLARAVAAVEYGTPDLPWTGPLVRRALGLAALLRSAAASTAAEAAPLPSSPLDVLVDFWPASCGSGVLQLVAPPACPVAALAKGQRRNPKPHVRCAGFEVQVADGVWLAAQPVAAPDALAGLPADLPPLPAHLADGEPGGAVPNVLLRLLRVGGGGGGGSSDSSSATVPPPRCWLRLTPTLPLSAVDDAGAALPPPDLGALPSGAAPRRVRYGHANWPQLSVYDGGGLPALPFDVAVG